MNVRGRVVIPKEVLESRDIMLGDTVIFRVKGDSLLIQKYEKGCFLCRNESNLIEFKDKKLCYDCIKEIKDM